MSEQGDRERIRRAVRLAYEAVAELELCKPTNVIADAAETLARAGLILLDWNTAIDKPRRPS